MTKDLRHTRDYWNHFNVPHYLTSYNSPIDENQANTASWVFFIERPIRAIHGQRARLQNGKALEFGAGPVLWPSFVLAQYVDTIHFADYTPQNLAAVNSWLDQKPDAHNWKIFFEYIMLKHTQITKLSQSSSNDFNQWEKRLRDALTRGGVSPCDVNDASCPILNGRSDEYNLIFSSLCLEAACLTIEIYKTTIKRMFRLLKPGGMLLLLVVRNETFYHVGDEKFFCLSLKEMTIQESLCEAGFIDIYIESMNATEVLSDMDGLMCVQAFKPISLQ